MLPLGALAPYTSKFPSLATVLTVDWPFGPSTFHQGGVTAQNFGGEPQVGFNNLSLEPGVGRQQLARRPVVDDLYKRPEKLIKPVGRFIQRADADLNDVGLLKSLVSEAVGSTNGTVTVG